MGVTNPKARDSALRRFVDVLGSAAAILFLSPLFLVIAVCIRLGGPGPILFRQVRVGKGEAPFRILKFRTMVVNAHLAGPAVSGKRDPRITTVGRFLRWSKLDEAPQFLNVLRGDMTLVGPRAEVPEMIRHYTPEEREILTYKPGITAPGQIFFTTDQAAELDEAEDAETYYVEKQLHPKLAMDLDYLERRNWITDLGVIWMTARMLLGFAGRSRTSGSPG